MGLFTRQRRLTADTSGLGSAVVALRLDDGDVAPAGTVVVIFNAGGHARRTHAGRVAREQDETVWCFHPGPYHMDLTPFAAAPELGLRLQFAIDTADPRVSQQRFDLYLHSEAPVPLALAALGAAIEAALQTELAQGSLDLPPCTAIEEWHEFRAGLNQLLYTRFGVTVDDCVPVDMGDRVDYAQMLAERAAQLVVPAGAALIVDAAEPAASAPTPEPLADADADVRALRRLFLELPALTGGWRLIALPPGQALFQSHQQLLQRLGLIGVGVATMPALAWAAPDQPLDLQQQARRASGSVAAARALDEAWALLAQMQLAAPSRLPDLFDDADRILSNLEHHLHLRRVPFEPLEAEEPSL